jgi:hypothetical protein
MTVTQQDLLNLGLAPGPHFAAALAEANRLGLTGAALQTFVRVLAREPAKPKAAAQTGAQTIGQTENHILFPEQG